MQQGGALSVALEQNCLQPMASPPAVGDFQSVRGLACAGRVSDLSRTNLPPVPGSTTFAVRGGKGYAIEALASASSATGPALGVLAGLMPAIYTGADETRSADAASLAVLEDLARRGAADASLSSFELQVALGREYNALWRFRAAETSYADAIAAHQAVAPADLSGRADLLAELALNLSSQGRISEAEARFGEADALVREAAAREKATPGGEWRSRFSGARLAVYRAQHLANAGDAEGALVQADAADAVLSALRATLGAPAASTATQAAPADRAPVDVRSTVSIDRSLSLRLGAPDEGASAFGGAGTMDNLSRVEVMRGQTAFLRAVMLERLRRPGGDAALDAANAALEKAPPGTALWLRAVVAEQRARNALAVGNTARALSISQMALDDYRRVSSGSRLEAQLTLSLAATQAAVAGRRDEALASYEAAFELYRSQLEEPGANAEQAMEYFNTLAGGPNAAVSEDATRRAFSIGASVIEPGVGRTIAQMAGRARFGESRDVVRALQDADREVVRARASLASIADGQNAEDATRRLDEAVAKRALAETAAQSSAPAYVNLVRTDASVEMMQGALESDEAFLQIVLAEGGGFATLVTKGTAHSYRVDLTATEARDAVSRIRASLEPDGSEKAYDIDSAHMLYRKLLEPVDARLRAAGIRQIIYSASSALSSVPFAALVTSPATGAVAASVRAGDYTKVDWAVRNYAFTQTVSASSFLSLRQLPASTASRPFRGFGAFVPPRVDAALVDQIAVRTELPQSCKEKLRQRYGSSSELKGTREELEGIVAELGLAPGDALVLGDGFSDAQVMTDEAMRDSRVISFATHGLLAGDECFTEPALVTSLNPAGGDGFLSLSEILDIKLSADLVILSACDTAAGGAGRGNGAEALEGLARAFFYAGARSLIATHWKVDDEITASAMSSVFASMRDGETSTVALQNVQKRLLIFKQTSHPYLWAPFAVIGDGSRTLART